MDGRRAGRDSGDVLHTAADVGRARRELGFTATRSAADGPEAEFEWVLEHAADPARLACSGYTI